MVSAPFSELVGQEQATKLLLRAIATHRIAPAYLFVGPHGVGRRLAAQAFLQQLLQGSTHRAIENHPDVLWIEPTYTQQGKLITVSALAAKGDKPPKAQPQVRLAQIRQIAQFLSQSPLEAARQCVVIDHAETMKEAAANGLLKTLEEPGSATLILLAPTADSLLPTLVSRCQQIPFRPLSAAHMQQVLGQAGHAEVLSNIPVLSMAQGSPGAAITAWEQLQTIPSELLERCHLCPTTASDCLALAQSVEQSLEVDAQLWLIDYLQQIDWQTYGQAQRLHILETARRYLRSYAQPRLVWEVTLLELMETVP
ncbi:DNA polymerase III subunit gamma/tau [Acaryochloris thomasi RCC1774]|uniref:DNA polymerase III subunit gamma/tau n=1 Tax=Acaryochloris thomasi RCC1774 TaxID=1764569 RepID=A0A2W1JY29_9CYAN|nr:DNA polymerase III subunit delta' [Acaryochloris thomasi]PZD75185.1 DNA polymerase III subunit gamma/tau [Acaryochloris thomasi RCC1774]